MSETSEVAVVARQVTDPLQADTYYFLKSITEERPYFGPRHASAQGDVGRHAYMQAAVRMFAAEGRRVINILEIGSWAGGSAVTWARALDDVKVDGRVYCVDHWKQQFNLETNPAPVYAEMVRAGADDVIFRLFQHNIRASGAASRVVTIRGAATETLPALAQQGFDIVFIDASHMYADVRDDVRRGSRLVADGGVLCGDDLELQLGDCDEAAMLEAIAADADYICDPRTKVTYHPGVTRAVGEAFGEVTACRGFWAVRRGDASWIAVNLPHVEPLPPPHLRNSVRDGAVRAHAECGFVVFDGPEGAIALREGAKADDLLSASRETWSAVPLVVTAPDVDCLRRKLRSRASRDKLSETDSPPILVQSDWHGYNIIRFRDQYFAVRQALGPIDLAQEEVGPLLSDGNILAASSQRDVELMVLGTEARDLAERAHALDERVRSLEQLLFESRQSVLSLDAAVKALDRALDRAISEAERAASERSVEHSGAMADLKARLSKAESEREAAAVRAAAVRSELAQWRREAEVLREWIKDLLAGVGGSTTRVGLVRRLLRSLKRRLRD